MTTFAGWRHGLRAPWDDPPAPGRRSCNTTKSQQPHLPLLAVVEGPHDVKFLRRISSLMHAQLPDLPDLAQLEQDQKLIFLPLGGGDVRVWAERLAPLGKAEVHLYDRESQPETALRQSAAARVNARPRCRAFVTGKHSLESYLAPEAIRECCGLEIEFNDNDNESVPSRVARQLFERAASGMAWEKLPRRARCKLRDKAKHWLNTRAVERMTFAQLQERDPHGDILAWLIAVADLLAGNL